jgi:hypothetical protein
MLFCTTKIVAGGETRICYATGEDYNDVLRNVGLLLRKKDKRLYANLAEYTLTCSPVTGLCTYTTEDQSNFTHKFLATIDKNGIVLPQNEREQGIASLANFNATQLDSQKMKLFSIGEMLYSKPDKNSSSVNKLVFAKSYKEAIELYAAANASSKLVFAGELFCIISSTSVANLKRGFFEESGLAQSTVKEEVETYLCSFTLDANKKLAYLRKDLITES